MTLKTEKMIATIWLICLPLTAYTLISFAIKGYNKIFETEVSNVTESSSDFENDLNRK